MSLPDIAELGFSVNSKPAVDGAQDLDKLTAATGRAETATQKLTATERAFGQTTTAAFSPVRDAATATKMLAAEQEALIKTQQRLNAVHGSAVGSSKMLQQATLNLGRQFADIGTSLGGGASPLMVLIQQGPQIADIFAQAKTQGLGFSAMIKALYAEMAPLLVVVGAVGVAVGVAAGAFAVFEQAVDKNTKHATTWGDTWNATIHVIGERIMDGPIGDGLKWLGGAFAATLKTIVDGTMSWLDRMVGFWGAAYNAVVANWRQLPQALGAILVGAANMTIQTVEGMINSVIKAVNHVAGKELIKAIDIPAIKQASNAIANTFEADSKRIAASSKAWREGFASDVAKRADKEWEERQKKKTKATKDHVKEILLETSVVEAANEIWPERAAAMEAAEKQAKALKDAQQALNVTLQASDRPATGLENMITALEEAQRQSDLTRNAVDDIFWSIRGNDWAGAFSGLLRTIDQVKKAFDSAATSKDKMAAIAGVAQGVGSAIGGTAGSAIGGAASGAMAGFTMGGPVGAVIGGLLGGISSLFGSSKAKKQAKAEAEAQRLALEQQRLAEEQARLLAVANERRALEIQLMELQGNAAGALAAARADELAKMDASNRALQEQAWALQDAAAAKAKADADAADAVQKAADLAAARHGLEIQLLEAMGKLDEANKLRLADERAALHESLRGLFDQVQAETALTLARNEATAAAEASAQAAAEAARAEQERMEALAKAAADLRAAQQSDAASLLSTARQNLKAAYERDVAAIKGARDQMSGFADSFRDFRQSLGGAAQTGADFYRIAQRARMGDTDAMGQLVGAAQSADASARSGASTQLEYLREQAKIRAAVQAAEDTANRQVSIADQQLAALNAQVAGFITVNDSVLTVAAGIAGVISAINTLNMTYGGAVSNPNRSWGANPDANMALARQTGFSGDFGSGGFQSWIEQQSEGTKATAREILRQQGQAYRIAFATGGSLTVGGSGGTDTTPVNFMATPGEVVNVSREDVMASLVESNRALASEVAKLRVEVKRGSDASVATAKTLDTVTRGGDSMLTEAA